MLNFGDFCSLLEVESSLSTVFESTASLIIKERGYIIQFGEIKRK